MAFKTILSVTGTALGATDLAIAAQLAEEAQAHLAVFVVAPMAPPPAGEFGMISPQIWLTERETEVGALEGRVKNIAAWMAERDVRGDVSSDYTELGRVDEIVGRRARYADLTVIGPELLSDRSLGSAAIDGVLFSSGRPMLVVPSDATATLRPKRVMVAWDHRVEASRAAREAIELLAAAEDVRLVLVDPKNDDSRHGEEPGADAAAWLTRHGVTVTVDRIPGLGGGTAETLARHATDMAAELIVMGAYGHSRVRERIFGGVTRSMLEAPILPILLAR